MLPLKAPVGIHRCSWVLISLVVFLLLLSTGRAADKPNIIIFLVDDMGPMDTSVPFMTDGEGKPKRYPLNDYYRTPGMERLASRGTRLNHFNAMSVCSPTRTSIITGQNATRHGVTQWIRSEGNNKGPFGPPEWNWTGFQDATRTLPGRLKTAGYRTIFIGKAHFGPNNEPSEFPENLGFDVNIAGCSWGQPGSYYGQEGYGHIKGNKRRAVPHLEKYHGSETFLTEALTLEAKQQIDAAVEDGKPFFLDLALYALHAPFHSNPRYAANYADSGKPKAAQAYATLVESMDTCLNQVMDHLESKGIAENTLILFLGDNGSDAPLGPTHEHHSSFPLRAKKGTHYEGGMRAPFIAAWAKPDAGNVWQQKLPIAQGAIQSQLGCVMDLYPTVLNLVDVSVPRGHVVDGKDLAKQLSGERNPDRDARFLMHFPHSHRSSYYTVLRLGDWKVVYHYLPAMNPSKTRYELFNLASDPYENHNLAEEQPQELKRLMEEMVDQLEAEGALFPVDDQGKELRPILPS